MVHLTINMNKISNDQNSAFHRQMHNSYLQNIDTLYNTISHAPIRTPIYTNTKT